MEFLDDAIVLAARPYGENHAVVDLLTQSRGRWTALVHGGQGRKLLPVLQPGNDVRAQWRGRAESLGYFTLELTRPRAAALLDDRLALAGLSAAAALTRAVLQEREACPRLHAAMTVFLDSLDAPEVWPPLYARYELGLLAELGFALSLDRCVATGAADDLIYVSPRSAGAVSAAAGAPYAQKLLPCPAFLRDPAADAGADDVIAAMTTTGWFLKTRVLDPLGGELPEARARLISLLTSGS